MILAWFRSEPWRHARFEAAVIPVTARARDVVSTECRYRSNSERKAVNFTRLLWTITTAVVPFASFGPLAAESLPYRSPYDVAYTDDGKVLAVSDRTAATLTLFHTAGKKAPRVVTLEGEPTGVCILGQRAFVAEYGKSRVAEIDIAAAKVVRRLPAGLRPVGVAVAAKRRLLLAANTVTNDVSLIDLKTGRETSRVGVPREPFFIAVTPDESTAIIGNLLPLGSAANPRLSAVVSLLDLDKPTSTTDVKLPPGSTGVRQIAVSPDGAWAYVVHTLGRFNVPSTQLDRGWVNTNALSLISLKEKKLEATVLLDHPFEGAADPWGTALSADGATLWISLRGVHRLARIDLAGLHRLLGGDVPDSLAGKGSYGGSYRSVWAEIQADPSHKDELMNDLSALHAADLIQKIDIEGNGPRGIAMAPNGETLAVACYYSGSVALVDTKSGKTTKSLSMGKSREPDLERKGEIIFHDATICFQKWLSCSTCHPDNGRTDGLRWDLMNDGLGTPQRTRSLLLSHKIRPTTARGVREEGIEDSVPKGLLFLLHVPEKPLVDALTAYISGLTLEPSPNLEDGKLSASAERGKKLFNNGARCSKCHPGDLGTDLEAHDVGTRGEFDREDDVFYTPKLIELYRSAPYLHDGRAGTLEDIWKKWDPKGKHGAASKLKPQEYADLIEYLKSR